MMSAPLVLACLAVIAVTVCTANVCDLVSVGKVDFGTKKSLTVDMTPGQYLVITKFNDLSHNMCGSMASTLGVRVLACVDEGVVHATINWGGATVKRTLARRNGLVNIDYYCIA